MAVKASDATKQVKRKSTKVTSIGKSTNTKIRKKRDKKRGKKLSVGQG
jgi:hypothetical protein